MPKKQSYRFSDSEPESDYPNRPAPAAPSGKRGLMIGLGLGGGALLLLVCCVCGPVGAWFGVSHYRGTESTGSGTDSGKGTDVKKVTDANLLQIKTSMSLEAV